MFAMVWLWYIAIAIVGGSAPLTIIAIIIGVSPIRAARGSRFIIFEVLNFEKYGKTDVCCEKYFPRNLVHQNFQVEESTKLGDS